MKLFKYPGQSEKTESMDSLNYLLFLHVSNSLLICYLTLSNVLNNGIKSRLLQGDIQISLISIQQTIIC